MTYLPYSDSLEQIQPDEAELTNKILDSMARVNRSIFDRHRHAVRDAHAKSHGTLKGELEIYPDLPDHLRQGIFSAPARYDVMARLSTAPGDLQSDRVPMPRGMAIKVLGVQGTKVLPNDTGRNQDFLLVNNPTLVFGHVAAYLKFQQAIEQLAGAFPIPPGTPPLPNHHILGETFHTMGALRFGNYVAKLSVAPLSQEVRGVTGTPIPEADSALRDLVADYFRTNSAVYELRAQLLTDIQQMPIEDASIEWPEALSAHQPIAKLTFPQQDTWSPTRRVYSDDVLSFNPWHTVEEHRPLGSIMRIRIPAYEASSRFRHEMNAQPRQEPSSIDELPL